MSVCPYVILWDIEELTLLKMDTSIVQLNPGYRVFCSTRSMWVLFLKILT